MARLGARSGLVALATAGLVAGALAAPVSAAAAPATGFVSHDAFLAGVSTAQYQTFAAAGRTGAVGSPQAFAEMRSYVLSMYQGVQANHSYLADGNYFDCVSIKTQPTVRALGLTTLATPSSTVDGHPVATASPRRRSAPAAATRTATRCRTVPAPSPCSGSAWSG